MTAYFALLFARTPMYPTSLHPYPTINITPSYVQLVAHQTVGLFVGYVSIDAGKLRSYHGTTVFRAVWGPFADNMVRALLRKCPYDF